MRRVISWRSTLVHAVLGLYALATLAPFAWAVLTSLKTTREIAEGASLLPAAFNVDAYRIILAGDFRQWLFNSLAVALAVTVLSLGANTLAGYALARLRFRGRHVLFQSLLLLVMVPAQVTMIPAYLIVARLGLADTHLALILTSIVNIASIFMMRQFFLSFPREIEEAARLDGCSPFATFVKVVLPACRPALATQAVFVFMAVWNDFMKPLLYISSTDKYMLTQGLNAAAKQYEKAAAWNITMAGSLITIVPILLIYIVLNRHLITLNNPSGGMK